jgi:hypothetical protein
LLGAPVGAAKAAIRGENLEGVLTQAIYDSAQFAAAGAVLTPAIEALGAFAGRKQLGKLKGAMSEFASTEANVALLERSSKVDLRKIVEAKNADPEGFARVVAASDDPQALQKVIRSADAIDKIAQLNPYASPSELLANPNVLNTIVKTEQSAAAREIFLNPSSPYKVFYDTNPNLKTMVERGHFGEAFDTLKVEIAKSIGSQKDFAEFVAMPFMNDAAALAEAKATALTSKKTFLQKGVNAEDFQNVLIKYDLNPTPALETEVKAGLTPKGFERYKTGAVRLGPNEVNNLVNETLSKNLQILADGRIRLEDVGIIQDQDAMLKALTTFNDSLNKTLFDSFKRFGTTDDWFGRVPPELQQIAQPLIKKKVYEQELGQMYRSLSQKQRAVKVALQEGDGASALIFKDEVKQANAKIRARLGQVREIDIGLQGAKPEDLKRAQDMVNEMFVPLRSQTMGKSAQKVDLTKGAETGAGAVQSFMQRFLPYENPIFIKKGSELADYTHSLLASNQDIGEFYKLSPLSIKRKIATELGQNNPISEMVSVYDQRTRASRQHFANLSKEVDALGIKAGSAESKLVEMLGEKKIDVTHEAFTSLPQQTQQRIITATQKMRGMYDEMLTSLNEVMRRNNLPEVANRQDYFHHFRQIQEELPEMLNKYFSGQSDEVVASNQWVFKRSSDPAMTTFHASKARKGILEAPGDAIAGFKIYAKGALDRIYYTDFLRQIDAAKWMAPKNLSTFLQNFKMENVLGLADDARLMNKGFKTAFEQARINQARGALIGKVSTALQQLTSIPLNFGIGYKPGLKAMQAMFTKEGQELTSLSTNLALRELKSEGAEFAPTAFKKYFGDLAGGKIQKGLDASEKFLEIPLQMFDRQAVKHGFLTGYYKGAEMGLTHEQAVRFGDYWVGAIQADMTKIGQPEFYQTTLGRALAQFQSFTINLFASLTNDLPRYANSDGAAKAVSMLLKTAAGVSISNEILRDAGIPGAFDEQSMVPFLGSARFGLPGLPGAIINVAKYAGNKAAGRDYEAEKNLSDLTTQAVSLTGIPGAGQIYKTGKYLKDKPRNDDFEEIAKGILFGKSSEYTKDEQRKALRKEEKSEMKKAIKGFVRRNF